MKVMNRKFVKAARKHEVELIGQVTGANGANLAAATRLVEQNDWRVPPMRTIDWNDVTANGLGKEDVGKVLVLN